MQPSTEALVVLSMSALAIRAGTALALVRRHRIARRNVDAYLRWVFTQLEES